MAAFFSLTQAPADAGGGEGTDFPPPPQLPPAPVLALSFRILPCHQEPMFSGLLSLSNSWEKTI